LVWTSIWTTGCKLSSLPGRITSLTKFNGFSPLDPSERISPADRHKLEPDDPVEIALLNGMKKLVTWPVKLAKSQVEKTPQAKRKAIEKDIEERKRELDGSNREPFRGEAYEELRDALSPMYDQLRLRPGWWILELSPLRVKKQKAIYQASDRISDYAWRCVLTSAHVIDIIA
jgi:hypothetical protein